MKHTKFFRQRKAKLFNGETVKKGDKVSFTNSDGRKCIGTISHRPDGTLFFWNPGFNIRNYQNAIKE